MDYCSKTGHDIDDSFHFLAYYVNLMVFPSFLFVFLRMLENCQIIPIFVFENCNDAKNDS